jgi:hypothetical protein
MYNIGAQDGLIDPKHETAMGPAIWLFLWCILCQTKRGFVLNGMALTYEEMSRRSGFPERKIRRWLAVLRKHNYVHVTHTNYCMMIIEVMKPKKWDANGHMIFTGKLPENGQHEFKLPENGQPKLPVFGRKLPENGHLNKIYKKYIKERPPTPTASAAGESFFERHGEIFGVFMGNRKRIPKIEPSLFNGYVVEFLQSHGFAARIVPKSEVKH